MRLFHHSNNTVKKYHMKALKIKHIFEWKSFKLVVANLFNYWITLLFSISKHFFLWQKHQQF